MRIGLSGRTLGFDRVEQQAVEAEAEGWSHLWYAGGSGGDPLLAVAFAGRATSSIELGTSIVQTYPAHPALMAQRAQAVDAACGGDGRFTLGVGPSHQPVIEGMYGMSYATPGTHTEEWMGGLNRFLGDKPVPVLIAALGPRLLRVAGEQAGGTITWMANARAIGSHVAPRITKAAEGAGRPSPRIVAGLPVAVHDDVDEARAEAAKTFAVYGTLPNYQRILAHGDVSGPAEAAIVGDEASVTAQLEALVDAGATDVWAHVFPVGDDRSGSRDRTKSLLKSLL